MTNDVVCVVCGESDNHVVADFEGYEVRRCRICENVFKRNT